MCVKYNWLKLKLSRMCSSHVINNKKINIDAKISYEI